MWITTSVFARARQTRLLPRIPLSLPHGHRGVPSGPRGGSCEREREGAGGAPAGQGIGRGLGGGARRR